ncbi:MAG: hypothetical protein NMK33_00020 [Candidatus Cardinium sp.]|nr:MAG: hypothetical protein NMK33_00020 [Candidatus Cardinium sp.]
MKKPGTVFDEDGRDQFVREFRRIPGNQMLIWEPVRVDWDTNVARNNRRPYTVEFRIRDLFTNFYGFRSHDDSGHLDIFNWDFAEHGRSPRYLGDRVDVDHLFRDNSITIELPAFLHREKNRFIDNLIRLPLENVIRESDNYWTHRPNRGRL